MIKSLALSAIVFASSLFASAEVNVYSHRHYDSDKELFKKFEDKTGIKVNVITAKAEELVTKLEIEGQKTPADLLITSDIGNLYEAKSKNLLQAVTSQTLNENIPTHLRDNDNNWFALTKRARIFVYNPEKVDVKDLSDYFSITNEKFKGRVITRSSTNVYNKALLASIIANHGETKALEFTKGLVANFAREPKGSDRDQIRAVAAGDADIAIVNTYYLGVMLHGKDQKDIDIAKSVKIFFPAQETTGTHINISGAGVTKYAKNKENAVKLMEFLSSEEAQSLFAEGNHEYPVNVKVKPSATVASWGTFKEDNIELNKIGENTKKAVEIATEGNWK